MISSLGSGASHAAGGGEARTRDREDTCEAVPQTRASGLFHCARFREDPERIG